MFIIKTFIPPWKESFPESTNAQEYPRAALEPFSLRASLDVQTALRQIAIYTPKFASYTQESLDAKYQEWVEIFHRMGLKIVVFMQRVMHVCMTHNIWDTE